MANTNETLPPVIILLPGFLTVDDSEPVELPPDPNWTNPVHVECRLTIISGGGNLVNCNITGTSNSTNNVTMAYNSATNTLEIELNDVGPNNGGSFNGNLEYQAAQIEFVYANIKKGNGNVGKVKHKINYGNE